MYFGEHNIEGMLAVLEPLHAMLERGAETIKENAFIQVFMKIIRSNLNVLMLCVVTIWIIFHDNMYSKWSVCFDF